MQPLRNHGWPCAKAGALLLLAGLNLIPNIGLLILPCYVRANSYAWFGFPISFCGWRPGRFIIGLQSLIPLSIDFVFFLIVWGMLINVLRWIESSCHSLP